MKRLLPAFMRNAVEMSFMGVTFLTGLAIAFLVPVLSLFLSDELHVRPLLVGAFFYSERGDGDHHRTSAGQVF